jgi:excisionase family DNA binding protein
MERLIDAVEAATYLGVSRPCIDKWVRAKFIPCVHIGRLLRFRPETLRNWVKGQEAPPKLPPHKSNITLTHFSVEVATAPLIDPTGMITFPEDAIACTVLLNIVGDSAANETYNVTVRLSEGLWTCMASDVNLALKQSIDEVEKKKVIK